jgi:hypothetical protein
VQEQPPARPQGALHPLEHRRLLLRLSVACS